MRVASRVVRQKPGFPPVRLRSAQAWLVIRLQLAKAMVGCVPHTVSTRIAQVSELL